MASAPVQKLPAISPLLEMGAYEALWADPRTTFRLVAARFREKPGALPSDFVPHDVAREFAARALKLLNLAGIEHFGIRVHGAGEYPKKLRDSEHPIELLYYRGWWDLVETHSVAVVGTRKPSPEGTKRTARLVRRLVADKFTIVSGLARGIDTFAHKTAIKCGGWTIAVIGTALTHVYPRENAKLQELIAKEYLLISQVPVCRYSSQGFQENRAFFPERNVTMSALTEATIIVEAGESSGTLIQARAALRQGRKLFILDNCFRNSALSWPRHFAERGAIRVKDYEDIQKHLISGANEDR